MEEQTGKVPVLVATDVAARGLDVRTLKAVVNYDMPGSLDMYIHRVGRTGRQGAPGQSFTFFTRNFSGMAPSLVQLLRARRLLTTAHLTHQPIRPPCAATAGSLPSPRAACISAYIFDKAAIFRSWRERLTDARAAPPRVLRSSAAVVAARLWIRTSRSSLA